MGLVTSLEKNALERFLRPVTGHIKLIAFEPHDYRSIVEFRQSIATQHSMA